MKKFVIFLLIACLLLGGAIGYFTAKSGDGAPLDSAQTPAESPVTQDEAASDARRLDIEALLGAYAPDEIVGSCAGTDVTWDELSYWLSDMGNQAQSTIDMMALYGQSFGWDDKISDESEQTFAEYTVEMAEDCVRQLHTIEALCAENGVTLSAEDEAAMAEDLRQDIEGACGEGASEEDFNSYLAENFVSRAMYDRLTRINYLYPALFAKLYGEEAGEVSEADAIAYLEDSGYLCAGHILFLTVEDTVNFEPLDEETVAKKLAQAEAVAAELRAIEDVQERAARFLELKEEYCDDPGKVAYPEGYLFAPGRMTTEFEQAVGELEEYEVSDPVLSPYGYHVIMRLPLSAEMTMMLPESGTAANARSAYASAQFSALVTARIDECVLTLEDGLSPFSLTPYLKEAE